MDYWLDALLVRKAEKEMSALELYAKQAFETKGTLHLHAIDSLRRYIRLTPIADLIQYINTLTDQDILRTLIEAGMPKEAWSAAIRRTEILRQQK
jgi:hypothetical protein